MDLSEWNTQRRMIISNTCTPRWNTQSKTQVCAAPAHVLWAMGVRACCELCGLGAHVMGNRLWANAETKAP